MRNFQQLLRPLARAPRLGNEENAALETIWEVVSAIPRGSVSTYGAVARAAGLPGHARHDARPAGA